MDEAPSVLWGRTRVRPTSLGLVVVIILVGTFVTGWGGDEVARGLLHGILLGTLVAGAVSAVVDLRSFRPVALTVARRATVGEVLGVIDGLGPLRPSIDLRLGAGPGRLSGDDDGGEPTFRVDSRGRYGALTIDVSTVGVVGVLRLSRRGYVPLAHPLWVAPSASEPVVPAPAVVDRPDGTEAQHLRMAATRAAELTSGVRPMVEGDLVRHAHWPATARRGSIHVRDFERPVEPPAAVVVDLVGETPVDDAIVARALATVTDFRRRGVPVLLHVARPDGPHAAAVDDPDLAFRLLAEAVPGSTTPPPAGVPVVIVDHSAVVGGDRPVPIGVP